jgi:cell division protein FtsL
MRIIGAVICVLALVFSLYMANHETKKKAEISKVEGSGTDYWYNLGRENATAGRTARFSGVPQELEAAYHRGEEDYRRTQ